MCRCLFMWRWGLFGGVEMVAMEEGGWGGRLRYVRAPRFTIPSEGADLDGAYIIGASPSCQTVSGTPPPHL